MTSVGSTPGGSNPLAAFRFSGAAAPADPARLPAWVRGRMQDAGLDPRHVLDGVRWGTDHRDGWNASAQVARVHPTTGHQMAARIEIGHALAERARSGPDEARRALGFIAAHEASHLVHGAVDPGIFRPGEPFAISEHVADMYARIATGSWMDRHAEGAGDPRHASDFRVMRADDGGAHTNVTILNDAGKRIVDDLGDTATRDLYADAVATKPRRFSQLAGALEASAATRFGADSTQASAVRAAWDGVGIDAGMRSAGTPLLTTRHELGLRVGDVAQRIGRPAAAVGALAAVAGLAIVGGRAVTAED